MTGAELIEMVSALDAAKEVQKQHDVDKAKAPAQILALLSSRCRNIDVRGIPWRRLGVWYILWGSQSRWVLVTPVGPLIGPLGELV
jgi:hypothetical protein